MAQRSNEVITGSKNLSRLIFGGIVLTGLALILGYMISAQQVVSENTNSINSDKLAIELMRYVRSMSDDKHVPKEGTFLYEQTKGTRGNALCVDYALVLKRMILDMKLGDARILNISFNPNHFDAHTLVEYFDKQQGEWIVLDPTFAIYAKRKSDGMYATAADIQRSSLNLDWSELQYFILDDRQYNYYLDYPLLFLNLHNSKSYENVKVESLIPYLIKVTLPVEDDTGWYVLQYIGRNAMDDNESITAKVEINGTLQTIVFDGIEQTTKVFKATSIYIPQDITQNIVAYVPNRFVFTYK
jgi:hypothetical protein